MAKRSPAAPPLSDILAGASSSALGRAAGVTQAAAWQWIKGVRRIPADRIDSVAVHLGIEPAELHRLAARAAGYRV